jgi:hypothetical protein
MHFRVDVALNRVLLSKLLDWYGGDFEKHVRAGGYQGGENLLLVYARPHLNAENRKALDLLPKPKVEFFDYDWGVNDVRSAARKN